MRVIVACPQCSRRYDVQGRRSGSRFRCLCGESLTVKAARGHDAAVVRCSSCGAPRQQGADACSHCGSDFTLHERDLHSVCPACLARVSDRARYCHHCAAPMFADQLLGEKSELHCPSCPPPRRLTSRRLGDFPAAVLECQRCAGLWLSLAALEEILEAESRGGRHAVGRAPSTGLAANTQPGYRRCAQCNELMARRNLARGKSGVVVDLCGHHGIWFDADELARLIAWTRAGGLEDLRRDLARLVGSRDDVRKRRSVVDRTTTFAPSGGTSRGRQAGRSARRPVRGEDLATWLTLAGQIAAGLLKRL